MDDVKIKKPLPELEYELDPRIARRAEQRDEHTVSRLLSIARIDIRNLILYQQEIDEFIREGFDTEDDYDKRIVVESLKAMWSILYTTGPTVRYFGNALAAVANDVVRLGNSCYSDSFAAVQGECERYVNAFVKPDLFLEFTGCDYVSSIWSKLECPFEVLLANRGEPLENIRRALMSGRGETALPLFPGESDCRFWQAKTMQECARLSEKLMGIDELIVNYDSPNISPEFLFSELTIRLRMSDKTVRAYLREAGIEPTPRSDTERRGFYSATQFQELLKYIIDHARSSAAKDNAVKAMEKLSQQY